MLAFADTADHISLGEFARTIIRANPFKGGTSEFAYPDGGGYDSICKVLGEFILEKNGERLAILGVEHWGSQARFQKYGDINKAKMGCLDDDIMLLLSHDPSHWEEHVTTQHPDIAVTFSGHTHGMQFGIEIPGFKWSPSKYLYRFWAGLYQQNNQQIYVNRGLGFIGYPGRVGILPEITVFELN